MPPNFEIKMILFQNSYSSIHRVATAHSKINAWLLASQTKFYTILQQYHFQFARPAYFLLLSQTNFNIQSHHRQSLNPSKSSALPSCRSSNLPQIQIHSGYSGNQRSRSQGMPSNFCLSSVSHYSIFSFFLNSSQLVCRK